MKRIGILFGMENTFPPALVERINGFEMPEVTAEFVQLGAVTMAEPSRYSVIVDRISHDVPFYRAYLKNAALDGTYIINNPFWWSADDKFFNYALATKLGVAIPRTVILPHKEHPPGTTDRSMRNLQYPLDWPSVFEYVGFPGVSQALRRRWLARRAQSQHAGGVVCRLRPDAHALHDAAGGGELQGILPLLRRRSAGRADHALRSAASRFMSATSRIRRLTIPALLARVEHDARLLCRALGYDLNTVEFAVEDGTPYAIDFMNPAPDADVHSVGQANFDWIVSKVAELAVRKAVEPRERVELRWDRFLAG